MTANGASAIAARSASKKRAARRAVGDRRGDGRAAAEAALAPRTSSSRLERDERDDRVDQESAVKIRGHRARLSRLAATSPRRANGRFRATTRQLSQPA